MESSSGSTGTSLPLPLDMSHHYSRTTLERKDSSIKAFYKYFLIPGIGNLAGGLPNESLFPYDTLEAQVAKPDRWEPSSPAATQTSLSQQDLVQKVTKLSVAKESLATSHITVPKAAAEPDPFKKIDLTTALQYGTAEGYPPLRSFLRQFTREHLHPTVPYRNGPEIILTCGSTDGFSKVVDLIVEPWFADRDDVKDRPAMLCEGFAYSNPMAAVIPKGVQIVPLAFDDQGMLAAGPGGLEDVLENWDPNNGKRPHFLYTVTMGHNPTGGVLSVARRREIYALCSKYDIIIVEDDPYWYLQYPSAALRNAQTSNKPVDPIPKPARSSGYDFLDSLVPSYLSIDVEGRVIRLDTFSKTVAPGCRLGWITAQPLVIERLLRITETSTQQPSGFVQSMVAELIMGAQPEAASMFRLLSRRDQHTFKGWNMDGWVRWLSGLRGVYERRMATMCNILDEHSYLVKDTARARGLEEDWGVVTKTQLLEFDWPRGGMFVWLKILFESHPLWQAKGDKLPVIDGPALAKGMLNFMCQAPYLVLPAPGAIFAATPEIQTERGWAFARLCFAAVGEEDVEACTTRFGKGIQAFWSIKSVQTMEDLIASIAMMTQNDDVVNVGYGMGC